MSRDQIKTALRERIVNHPRYPPNDLDDTFDILRDELERAAVEAEGMIGATRHEIATAIRKLKE